jgi:hypothetical protein
MPQHIRFEEDQWKEVEEDQWKEVEEDQWKEVEEDQWREDEENDESSISFEYDTVELDKSDHTSEISEYLSEVQFVSHLEDLNQGKSDRREVNCCLKTISKFLSWVYTVRDEFIDLSQARRHFKVAQTFKLFKLMVTQNTQLYAQYFIVLSNQQSRPRSILKYLTYFSQFLW